MPTEAPEGAGGRPGLPPSGSARSQYGEEAVARKKAEVARDRTAAVNVVVLGGRLTRPAEVRTLASGERLATYEVAVPSDERAGSVPVVWPGPPASAEVFAAGLEVVVVGWVRRRFFRAGGATQSRTEVVAEAVVPARQAKRAAAVVERARGRLTPPSA